MPVLKADDQIFLLVLERDMTVLANLQGTIENKVDLNIGVNPGLGVHAVRPFPVYLRMASAAFTGPKRVKSRRWGRNRHRRCEFITDHKEI